MKKIILNLGLFAALTGALSAGELVTYQGRLKEGGSPVTANRSFSFEFCATEAGTGCVASPSAGQYFQVVNGLFKSTFTAPSVDFAAGPWYLRVSVEGTPLSPLERLTHVPYAVYAASSAYASALSVASGQGVYSSTNVAVSGSLTVSDFSIVPSTEAMMGVSTVLQDANPGSEDIRIAVTGYGRSASTDANDVMVAGNFETEIPAGMNGIMAGLRTGSRNYGTAAKAVGLMIDSIQNSGTVGETYGLRIATMTGGTQLARPYAIYSEDPNASHYFAGSVGISSVPAYSLAVSSGTGDIFWVAHDAVHAVKFVGDGSGLTGVTGASGTDDTRVLKAGDTMTGQLTLAGSTLTVTGDSFSVNNTAFMVTPSGVGIGIVPANPFQVSAGASQYVFTGDTTGADATMNLVHSAGGVARINDNSGTNAALALALGHVNHVLLNNAGDLGIGAINPSYRLHVSSGAGEAGTVMAVSTGATNLFWVAGDGAHALKFYGDGSALTGISADLSAPLGTLAVADGGTGGTTAADARTNLGAVNVAGDTMTGPLAFSLNNAVFSNAVNTGGIVISTGGAITTSGQGTGSVSGNPRGLGAVDLQTARVAAGQVASGNFSSVLGGFSNTVSAVYASVAGGNANSAGGQMAFIGGGNNNTASGGYSAIPGGDTNFASGLRSFAAGFKADSAADGAFTWADSEGTMLLNSVNDRTRFKSRGGFLVSGSTDAVMTGQLNRGLLVTGNGLVGVSTGSPQAALDVVSDNAAVSLPAQIWRDSSGAIVSSMSSAGHLMAVRYVGDGSGLTGVTGASGTDTTKVLKTGDTMTGQLTITGSSLTVSALGTQVGLKADVGGGHLHTITSQALFFGTGDVDRMLIDNLGNVAVNKTPANYRLDVGGAANFDGQVIVGGTVTVAGAAFSVGGSSLVVAGGNVGVGTASPAYRLHISSGAGETGTLMAVSTGAANVFWVAGDGAHATAFYGNGTGLTGVPGDNLGNHVAASDLNMAGKGLVNVSTTTISGPLTVNTSSVTIRGSTSDLVRIDGSAAAGFLSFTKSNTAMGNIAYVSGAGNLFAAADEIDNALAISGASGLQLGDAFDMSLTLLGGKAGINKDAPLYSLDISTANISDAYVLRAGNDGIVVSTGGAIQTTGLGHGGVAGAVRGHGAVDLQSVRSAAAHAASGTLAVLSGGGWNEAGGAYSVVPGGSYNQAAGSYSFAAGYAARSIGSNTFTWADSGGNFVDNTVPDRALFKAKGGFMVTGSTNSAIGSAVDRGVILVNGTIGVSTGAPMAAVDVVSTGTAGNVYAQIWRNSSGVVVASMSSQGYFSIAQPMPGDNLGNHNAGQNLQMNWFNIQTVSSITAAGHVTASAYQINGSTVLGLSGTSSFSAGIGAGNLNAGSYGTFLGYFAGGSANSGNYNSFLGFNSGNVNTYGAFNTFAGAYSGAANTTGGFNVMAGYAAGNSNQTGSANAALGSEAGKGVGGNSFSSSTLAGYRSGYGLTTGSANTFLGFQSGYSVTTGTGNIVIGYNQDLLAPTTSNQLNIGGVLFGNLSSGAIGISTRTPASALDVNGTLTLRGDLDSPGNLTMKTSAIGSSVTIRAADGNASTGGQVLVKGGSYTGGNNNATGGHVMISAGELASGSGGFYMHAGSVTINAGDDNSAGTSPMAGSVILNAGGSVNGAASNGTLLFKVGNSEKARISGAGLVGIGTASPGYKLDVQGGNINASGGMCIADTCVTSWSSVTGVWTKAGSAISPLAPADNVLIQSTLTVQGSAFSVGGSTLAVYQGKVGIGSGAPAALLDVRDAGASSGFVLRVATGTATDSAILVVTTGGIVGVGTLFPSTQTAFHAQAIATDKNPGAEDVSLGLMGSVYAYGTGAEDAAAGGDFTARADGAQNVGHLVGIHTSVERTSPGTGSIGKAMGLFVDEIRSAALGTGKITDTYGVYIATMATENQTNAPYSLYALDQNARSYFAGKVGFGTPTPQYALEVSSAAGSSDPMLIVSTGGVVIFGVKGNGEVYTAGKYIGDGSLLTNVNISTIVITGSGLNITTSAYAGASGVFISSGGAIQTAGAGHGSVTGNGRGLGAVDLQTYRALATEAATGDYAVIAGGFRNTASANQAAVLGGSQNNATNQQAIVVGGYNNGVSGAQSTIGGGASNSIGASEAFIGNGYYNRVEWDADNSVIGGGYGNQVYGKETAIGGGRYNLVTGSNSVVGGGSFNVAAGTSAVVAGGEYNRADQMYSAVLGGWNNSATGLYSVSVAGKGNSAQAYYSAIGGGYFNSVAGGGSSSVIAGGELNVIMADAAGSFIGGGYQNYINPFASESVVAGGQTNFIYDWAVYSAIAGGKDNRIGAYSSGSAVLGGSANQVYGSSSSIAGGGDNMVTSTHAFIGGGMGNRAGGQYSFVGGGYQNKAAEVHSAVAGGWLNQANGMDSFVGGGKANVVWGAYSFVGGGGPSGGVTGNIVDGAYSSIVGGSSNTITSVASLGFIGGGSDNHLYGDSSVIGGGARNAAGVGGTKFYAAVTGGHDNQALGEASFVGGGSNNAVRTAATAGFIGGGEYNQVNLPYAAIPGGLRNAASGDYSFAAGYQSTAAANGTFSWKDSQPDSIVNNLADQVMFKAAGGFWVSTSTNYGLPALYVTPGNNVSLGITGSAQSRLTIVEPYPQVSGGNQYLVRVGTGAIPSMLAVSTMGVVSMPQQSVVIASSPIMGSLNAGWTQITTFSFEELDTQNEMLPALFVARTAGRYLVTLDATLTLASASNSVAGAGIRVNGEPAPPPSRYVTSEVSTMLNHGISLSHVYNLQAGGTLEFYLFANVGAQIISVAPQVTITKLN